MLTIVNQIEGKLRDQPFLSLNEVRRNINKNLSGFYWIYTNLPINELKNASNPANNAHVDIRGLAVMHEGINNIINQIDDNLWCIYNGKGKRLRDRIVAEFTNTSGKTGKLAILRCFDEQSFKVKYVSCGVSSSITQITMPYLQLEKHLERLWRLHIGWPILCKQ